MATEHLEHAGTAATEGPATVRPRRSTTDPQTGATTEPDDTDPTPEGVRAGDAAAQGPRDELYRLAEAMPAALVRLSRDWTLAYVNGQAETILGRPRDELLGASVHDIVPGLAGSSFGRAYAAAMESGQPVTVEDFFAPLDAWFEVRAWPDEHGLTLYVHDVSERARTHLALTRARDRLAVLAAAGSRLSSSLTPHEVLSRLAGLILPELGCSVTVALTEGVAGLLGHPVGAEPDRLHVVLVAHVDPDHQAELRDLLAGMDLRAGASSGLGRTVSTGRHQFFRRVPDEMLVTRSRGQRELKAMRRLNTGEQLVLPLTGGGRVHGAVTVGGATGQQLDQRLLAELAERAAVALDNALAYARQDQAATVLQRALLPQRTEDAPGVRTATRYLPSAEQSLAGGDFFRQLVVDGTLVCAIGDVMGHGTESAARAGQLHGIVATLALQGMQPGRLLSHLSAGVHRLMDLELATLLVCGYDPATCTFTAATAGHPPPLVAPPSGEPYYVPLVPGPPLGVTGSGYEEHTVHVPRGSTVVLFSDGLVERRGESLSDGLERLRTAVPDEPLLPEAMADHLLSAAGVSGGAPDDVVLLVLNHP